MSGIITFSVRSINFMTDEVKHDVYFAHKIRNILRGGEKNGRN